VQVTKAIALALESGRSAVAMLDAVVGRMVSGNRALERGWRRAKRVTVPTRKVRRRKKA